MKTPVLLITFNRPDHVRRVLSAIRDARPASLYVFQDGAREGNAVDAEKCPEVRAVVQELVDWDCDLHTFYADRNFGCGAGPMTGINWFFNFILVVECDSGLRASASSAARTRSTPEASSASSAFTFFFNKTSV